MTYVTKHCEWEYKKGVTCAAPLTERVYNYSITNYGRPLCYGHQKQSDVKEPNTYTSVKEYQEITGEI